MLALAITLALTATLSPHPAPVDVFSVRAPAALESAAMLQAASAITLPSEIPLFPLPEVVLFPAVQRPLLIYEPRYREMIADALKGDHVIGTVLLRPGFEADYEGRPPIYGVGCAGVIEDYEQLPDGRYAILLRGLTTFRVVSEDRRKPYRLAHVEAIPELLKDDERGPLSTVPSTSPNCSTACFRSGSNRRMPGSKTPNSSTSRRRRSPCPNRPDRISSSITTCSHAPARWWNGFRSDGLAPSQRPPSTSPSSRTTSTMISPASASSTPRS